MPVAACVNLHAGPEILASLQLTTALSSPEVTKTDGPLFACLKNLIRKRVGYLHDRPGGRPPSRSRSSRAVLRPIRVSTHGYSINSLLSVNRLASEWRPRRTGILIGSLLVADLISTGPFEFRDDNDFNFGEGLRSEPRGCRILLGRSVGCAAR